MKTLKASFLISACLGVAFVALTGLAQETRFYVRGDVGGQWTSDTPLKEFFGEPLAPGAEVKFDPGVRLGISGGYLVTDWFAAEAQTGIMANEIDSITGATRLDEARFWNVPFLMNARFQCPTECRLSPYAGGGLGFSSSVVHADHLRIGDTTMRGTQVAAVFAYQAFAGLRYRINEHMGLSLEYRYFATTDPEWEADTTSGTPSDKMRFGDAETHTVSVAFDYRF
jgi:OmpA-OmpF porin, OOP family